MKENQYNVPILLIAFNRPNITQKVFNEIKKIEPKQLFFSVDGPREGMPGEDKLCEATKDIIKQVNWKCEVKTLFNENNLGCGIAPMQAISWFFENVEEGIILEDDCIPTQSFFRYSQELLEHYRNNEKIMVISGNNFQFGQKRGEASYYFSIYPHTWGWATWRRAWKHFDFAIKSLPEFKTNNNIQNIFKDKSIQKYWLEIFDKVYGGKRGDIWDYQWLYAVWSNNGLAIIPNVNLVSNEGFGPEATHTKKPDKKISGLKTEDIHFPLIHPETIKPNTVADTFTSSFFFQRNEGLKGKLKKILKLT